MIHRKSRVVVPALVICLAGCATTYMEIDPASSNPTVARLADRARSGDKNAVYELALRFAAGDGLVRDCGKARALMRMAATRSGGTIWVYSPPVRKGGSGRVIPVTTGPVRPGLEVARVALADPDFCR